MSNFICDSPDRRGAWYCDPHKPSPRMSGWASFVPFVLHPGRVEFLRLQDSSLGSCLGGWRRSLSRCWRHPHPLAARARWVPTGSHRAAWLVVSPRRDDGAIRHLAPMQMQRDWRELPRTVFLLQRPGPLFLSLGDPWYRVLLSGFSQFSEAASATPAAGQAGDHPVVRTVVRQAAHRIASAGLGWFSPAGLIDQRCRFCVGLG